MDIESLIEDVCPSVWWKTPVMRHQVWSALIATRTTLHRCGYGIATNEYQSINFLLAILRDKDSE